MADSQKLDCFSRFLPLCTVAMVPCRLSYLKLILEMPMDYYANFHIGIQHKQRAQTPDQTNKRTNKQQSADSRFSPLCKVAMVPCRLSYSKLILEMLMVTPTQLSPRAKHGILTLPLLTELRPCPVQT